MLCSEKFRSIFTILMYVTDWFIQKINLLYRSFKCSGIAKRQLLDREFSFQIFLN